MPLFHAEQAGHAATPRKVSSQKDPLVRRFGTCKLSLTKAADFRRRKSPCGATQMQQCVQVRPMRDQTEVSNARHTRIATPGHGESPGKVDPQRQVVQKRFVSLVKMMRLEDQSGKVEEISPNRSLQIASPGSVCRVRRKRLEFDCQRTQSPPNTQWGLSWHRDASRRRA